jgi:hypothetical protein
MDTTNTDDVHNYLTDLGYGYSDIRGVMSTAITDPREGWYFVDDAQNHAVRYVR